MCEWRECFCHVLVVLTLFNAYRQHSDFGLVNMYAEVSKEDSEKTGLCKDGKVAKITSGKRWRDITKGNGTDSLPLAPGALFKVKAKRGNVSLAAALHWRLEDVTGNGRSIFLIFNRQILKVCYSYPLPLLTSMLMLDLRQFSFGTHTSPQWLTRDMWELSILPTTHQVRYACSLNASS